MPITIKTGVLNYKDPTSGEYVGVDMISGTNSIIADEYSSQQTYLKDEYCIHECELYKAKQNISPAEVWTAAHWDKTTVMVELSSYKTPYRLIREYTITEETGNINISTDTNGDPLSLTDVIIYFNNVVATANSNCLILVNGDDYTGKHITVSNLWSTSAKTGVAFLNVRGGRFFGESMSGFANTYNPIAVQRNLNASGILECSAITSMSIGYATTSSATNGTITIYGR